MTDDTLTLNTPTTHSHSLELRARLSHKPPGAGSAAVHPARFSAATVVLQRPAHKESSPAHVRRVRAPLLPGGSWIAAGTYTSRVRIHSLTCVRLSRGPSSRAVGHRRSPRSLAGRRDAGTVPQRRQQYRARSRGYQHRLRQGPPNRIDRGEHPADSASGPAGCPRYRETHDSKVQRRRLINAFINKNTTQSLSGTPNKLL
jgi:hypothetical protein